MLGIKNEASLRSSMIIAFIFLVLGFLAYKNSQVLMRTMVGQETRWRTASFQETQSSHYIIKYTSSDTQVVPIIEQSAEEAYTSVSNIFGRDPQGKITLVVYPDESSLAQSFGWDRDEKAMGVYWGGTIRILSPRAYLHGPDLEGQFYREGPMVHEFTHLMVDDVSHGNYNRWWTEGIAQYVEKEVTGFEFADPFANGQQVKYYDLGTLEKQYDQLDQKVAYWESLKTIEWIVDNYGQQTLFDITSYLGQGYSMKQALEKGLGIPYSSFESQVYNELQGA
ncbi:MAG TPA: hypothetical protein VN426_05295 [Syntrophomonadaceae bacterium]|nr:hypothetical protein [Syntrophomonadaceae bacterium]